MTDKPRTDDGKAEIHFATYGEQSAETVPTACGIECSTWDTPLKYVWDLSKATCPACLVAALADRPNDATGQGRLLLNAYGRQCYDAGRASMEARVQELEREVARLKDELQAARAETTQMAARWQASLRLP